MTTPRRPSDDRGLTLVEVLVVVGIVVLVASLATPLVAEMYRAGHLDHSAEQVRGAFQHARQKAITTRTPHRVVFYRLDGRSAGRFAIRVLELDEDPSWVGDPFILTADLQLEDDAWIMDGGAYVFDTLPSLSDPSLIREDPGDLYQVEPDGTIRPGPYLRDVGAALAGDGRTIYDPTVEARSLSGEVPADIKLVLRDGSAACWIDVALSSGRVAARMATVEGSLASAGRSGGEGTASPSSTQTTSSGAGSDGFGGSEPVDGEIHGVQGPEDEDPDTGGGDDPETEVPPPASPFGGSGDGGLTPFDGELGGAQDPGSQGD